MSQDNPLDFLQSACKEVWWTTSRLPTNKQVSADTKRDMVKPTEGETSGYSVSKRIFSSSHPAVQRVNEVFRNIDELRDSLTILKAASASSAEGRFNVEPGCRIIMLSDVEEFEAAFTDLQAELAGAVTMVAHCINNSITIEGKIIPSIKEMDKAKLAKSFSEKDYPTPEELIASVKVTNPQYGSLKPELLLPQAILERETARVTQELDDSIVMAAERVNIELLEAMESLARSLSNKTYADPLPDGGELCRRLVALGQVEITNVWLPRHNQQIPSGHVAVEISYKQDKNGKTITCREILAPMPTAEYERLLRPWQDKERRQLRAPAVAKVEETLYRLSRIRPMLMDKGETIEKSLAKVKEILGFCRSANGRPVDQLKTSEALSEQLRAALNSAVSDLAEMSEAAVEYRRRISC